ncbi:MAG: hypothetical protein RLZZ522_352, partial [Verrucomicrobiota bacterium]
MKSTPLTQGFQTIARALAKLPLSGAAALLAAAVALPVTAATTDNALKMEVMAAPNLVVDSNVETPSSYSPSAAHLAVKITNTGATPLTDIYVKMGNFDPVAGTGTPGTYPVTTVPAEPAIGYSGTFFFTHEGTAADATRYLPSLAAGASTTVYWLVSYPLKDSNQKSVTAAANVTSDDLRLDYDVWVQATEGGTSRLVYDERHATCRNEISAAANKIWPNTTSKVPLEYLNAIESTLGWRPDPLNPRVPGAYVQEGIWYDLGNVGAGFDNDGDGLPDRNAWMQPVGDPSVYNAQASRLVKCYGLVIVKLNDGTEQLIPFEDRLYFQNLPGNNTGAIGLVYYEFIPLDTTRNTTLTPYQEVASGYDNEKFNGDYGVVVGTVASTPPSVTLGKTATSSAAPGGTVSYTLTTTNTGTTPYGWPAESLPIVMEDAIPSGTTYVLNSATTGSNLTVPSGGIYTVYYSIDSGSTWTTTQPAAASVTRLRWVLDRSLAASATATVAFQATIGGAFAGTSVVNTGILKSGTDTQVTTATAATTITGLNSVGDFIWGDLNRNGTYESGTETGIANIKVSLYIDSDNDGTLDPGEPLFRTTSTAANGGYGFD